MNAEHFASKGVNEMQATKGMRFPIDVILECIRWYAARNAACLSTISSINRWAIRFFALAREGVPQTLYRIAQ